MRLLVLGANSDIAMATAHCFADKEGADVILASRNVEALRKRAEDIETRYQVKTQVLSFDALDFESHADFYASLDPKPDVVLLAFGNLPDQAAAQKDFQLARMSCEVNFTGAVSILEIIAADFETKGRGQIIAIGSPAGLRGRKSNYFYGAAKGALMVYLSGLRHRLYQSKVRVMTVIPGFVDTKMTQGMDLPEKLTASPDQVAADIHRAFRKGKDTIYSKWIWRWIMLIIRLVPEWKFKQTNL